MYTIEEFDESKSKVLKYVLYKKRTIQEVKTKFGNIIESEMLNDILDELEENDYIDDNKYIEKAVNEFKVLDNLSIKEIKYKLYSKGIPSNLIEDYISNNIDNLIEYELESAKKIAIKKMNFMDKKDITQFLLKKGYTGGSVKEAIAKME